MKIAFDAKRAYHNGTGLGNYSRTLISDLAAYHPDHDYYLINPKPSHRYSFKGECLHEILPQGFLAKKLTALWRSKWVVDDLVALQVDLYHGLSHEIPIGMETSGIKSVVTIHDLIFERFPDQYNPLDVRIYHRKFKYACEYANRIIAISQQTKADIVHFYGIDADKIDVCYQSCDPSFHAHISDVRKRAVKKRYSLPDRFFLSVGSIIDRKNLLNVCKALRAIPEDIGLPLVVVGTGRGPYRKQIQSFLEKHRLTHRVIFLSEHYTDIDDLPAIYSLAEALLYPSFFEGFGIPILEALRVGIPVITAHTSCLPEAGGNAAIYVDPNEPEEIAAAMRSILEDKEQALAMINRGFAQADKFSNLYCANQVAMSYIRTIKGV